jgi:putative transposase
MRRSNKQGELNSTRGTWGGWRPGAGRKPGPNPPVPHESRLGVEKRFPYHVTVKVRREVGSLRQIAIVQAVEASFRKACERGKFRLVAYVLEDDHAHLLVEADNADELGRGMMALCSRLARAVNRALRRSGQVLADRYHLVVLKTPQQTRNALRYLLLNSKKHGRRGVERARAAGRGLSGPAWLDPASSARWFPGWRGAVDRSTPRGLGAARAVAAAQTWLLREGWWKKHGLIDPRDIPGPRPSLTRGKS